MPEQTLKCPKCGYEIPLTEAYNHQIEERLRQQFEADGKRKEREYAAALKAKEQELEAALRIEKNRLVTATAGMCGDRQGIIGNALPVVKTLELPGSVESTAN